MNSPINPQEPKPDIAQHLQKHGIKMNKRTSPGNAGDTLQKSSGSVNINNNGNPNSKSSYSGIFGY